MIKYRFDMIEQRMAVFVEKDHIIQGHSLADAVTKFCRKHGLEAPAYWDEPSYDTFIDLTFTGANGSVRYRISWGNDSFSKV